MSVAAPKLAPATVNVRTKISALWTTMLFVFAYVDIFGLYRPDVRADLEAGQVGGFDVGQAFLLGTTAYVVVPALMVIVTFILQAAITRAINLVLAPVYAITIIAAAFGEWNYYILGTVIEIALLAGVAYYAWTWPRQAA